MDTEKYLDYYGSEGERAFLHDNYRLRSLRRFGPALFPQLLTAMLTDGRFVPRS